MIGVAFFIVSAVLYHHLGALWFRNKVAIYITSAKSVAFIKVSIVTYTVIFWKYKKSRDRMHQFQSPDITDRNQQSSTLHMFRNSRFYVSVLIIFTYLLFNTIPYCVFTFLIENNYLTNKKHITTGSIIAGFMIHLGYTSDAIIYIFLQNNVRKTLSKMVCRGENSQQN